MTACTSTVLYKIPISERTDSFFHRSDFVFFRHNVSVSSTHTSIHSVRWSARSKRRSNRWRKRKRSWSASRTSNCRDSMTITRGGSGPFSCLAPSPPAARTSNTFYRWVDEQVTINKENVNERLAAMGAATAQVNWIC